MKIKTFVLLLFLIVSSFGYSQDTTLYKTSLDNSLTGAYAKNTVTTTTLTFVGNNSYAINKYACGLTTTYTLAHNPNISQNELVHRTNFSFNEKYWFVFATHQYSYSYLRKIDSDNWAGIGGGIYRELGKLKLSLSYGLVKQKTDYFIAHTQDNYRHSIRVKAIYEKGIFSFNTDYYFQPSMLKINNIITGTTKLVVKAHKYVNFTVQDVVNYSSSSNVKMIHNLTIGLSYTFKNEKIKTK